MFTEFYFDDIVFGIFPKVGTTMEDAYGFWAKNSVGDIIDMLIEESEVILGSHIYGLRISCANPS
jgi:hypothetical protein